MWRVWIGIGCVLAGLGCEDLRPVVVADVQVQGSTHSFSPGFQSARRLYRNGAAFPSVTLRLRQSVLAAATEEQAESAQRLLIQVHIEWYQRLRIAEAVIPEARDVGALYGALLSDIRAWSDPAGGAMASPARTQWVVAPGKKDADIHSFLMSLRVSPRSSIALASTVHVVLLQEVERLAEAHAPRVRAFAKAAQRFLELEPTWRYGLTRSDKAAEQQVRARAMQLFVDQYKRSGLADNAWLALAVQLGHGLAKPTIPVRSTLQTAAVVLNKKGPTVGRSLTQFLEDLGAGRGETLLEQWWGSWRTLQATVNTVLERHKRRFSRTDGVALWKHLKQYWRFDQGPLSPSPSDLHGFGASMRSTLVASWLRTMRVESPLSRRRMDRLERIIGQRLEQGATDDTSSPWKGLWAMTVLTIQDEIGVRLGVHTGGRPPRLVHAGVYEKRALFLPGGGRLEAFPAQVKRCVATSSPRSGGCLSRIVERGVRSGRARPDKPSTPHRVMRKARE
jgi:hypothetical protein